MFALDADSLAEKSGFNDGSIISNHLDDEDADDEIWIRLAGVKEREVLVLLVQEHLLPVLPGVETEVFGTIHNPIRATSLHRDLVKDSDISVEISRDMVLAAIDKLAGVGDPAP